MTLRSEAIAAYRADWEATAREVLADTLKPSDVSGLDVLALDVQATYTLVVFSDGDVHLAVSLPDDGDQKVSLVADDGAGGWTEQVVITSLAHLGEVLPEFDPVDENAAPVYPEWATATQYVVDDVVTYNGEHWRCIQAHTSQAGWEPPNVAALWSLVA